MTAKHILYFSCLLSFHKGRWAPFKPKNHHQCNGNHCKTQCFTFAWFWWKTAQKYIRKSKRSREAETSFWTRLLLGTLYHVHTRLNTVTEFFWWTKRVAKYSKSICYLDEFKGCMHSTAFSWFRYTTLFQIKTTTLCLIK